MTTTTLNSPSSNPCSRTHPFHIIFLILVILFLVLVLVRGSVGGHEPYEAQPGTEGVDVVQGGSPVSPW